MRYFIRSLKTFLYFLLIFVIIIAIFVISGMAELNIETMFRDGYKSLWQIFGILILIAAVYPKVSYVKTTPRISGNMSGCRVQIIEIMQGFGYVLEKESVNVMTFRQKSAGARFSRKFEDRITFEQGEGGLTIEGLRKDVVRIVSRMEYRINNNE